MRKIIVALFFALMPTLAVAQSANQFPSTMPSGTVYGRLGIGAGPGQPVPITSLLSATQQSTANKVLAGPTSGGTGAMTPRSLIYGDFPSMSAGTLLGNPGSAPAVPQAFGIQNLPNLPAPNATLDFLPIYDHASGQLKYSSPSQLPGVSSPLTQNNAWTGTNDFQGTARFGGQPWFDVKSAAQGCAAASGNSSTDDTSAIQCHINYMYTTYGGGIVFFPPSGTYIVSGGGLLVKGGVQLVGSGPTSTKIAVTTDSKVVTIDSATCAQFSAVENLWILGYQNASATQSAVTIGSNCPTNLINNYIWFGANGLNTSGVDGMYFNNYICNAASGGYAVSSNGANWYVRDKLDSCGLTTTGAFIQGVFVLGGSAENHFTQTDFSGNYTNSVVISDSGNGAITVFDGGVFSAPISIGPSKFTSFVGAEFGATSFTHTGGAMSIAGSFAFAATSVTGGGTRACSANISITC